MKARKVFALSILTASMALAAGCSSDDDDEGTPDTTDPTDPGPTDPTDPGPTDPTDPGTTDPDPMSPEATMTGTSILDIARGTDGSDGNPATEGVADLSELLAAAGQFPAIVNLLDDESQTLTVFAPNNAAFAALGDGTEDGETEDGETEDGETEDSDGGEIDIENTLLYHVGTDMSLDTMMSPTYPVTLMTAQGASITVSQDDTGAVVVTDSAGTPVALGEPVTAANGTVYIIDQVLVAPDAEDMTTDPGETTVPGGTDNPDMAGGPGASEGSTLAALEGDEDLSSVAAIAGDRAQSLQATDDSNRAQIVFAPRNDTFDAGATSILAYTVTASGTTPPGGPAPAGMYESFGDLTGDSAGTKLQFDLQGEGEDITVNGLPAELIPTTSGPVLYVYGGEVDDGDDG